MELLFGYNGTRRKIRGKEGKGPMYIQYTHKSGTVPLVGHENGSLLQAYWVVHSISLSQECSSVTNQLFGYKSILQMSKPIGGPCL